MATKAEKLLAKGQGLEKKGKRDKALEVYRDGCRAAPYDPDIWTARAELALALGMDGEAAEALFHVSDLFARGGMPAEALRVARRVLELDKAHSGARRFVKMLEARLDDQTIEASPPPAPTNGKGDGAGTSEAPRTDATGATGSATEVDEAGSPTVASRTEVDEVGSPTGGSPTEVDEAQAASQSPAPAADAPAPAPVRAATQPTVVYMQAEAPPESEHAPLSPPVAPGSQSEHRIGRMTVETALESLSLVEVVTGGDPDEAGGSEIPLDDGVQSEVMRAVASTISSSPLLSELDSELLRLLIDCGVLVHRAPGEAVFEQGEIGTSLFLVLGGEVCVEHRGGGGETKELARLRPGAFFGEMALLTNMPRSATVRAMKTADLLEISRRAVRTLVDRDPRVLKLLMRFFRARLVGTLLQTSPLFRGFTRDERRLLVGRFRLRELARDLVVIRAGDVVEGLFLVLVGNLTVTHGEGDARTTLATLGPGDVFGEMSLLDSAPASATVTTKGRTWLLLLGREDFIPLVGAHPELREQLAALATERRERNRAALAVEPILEDHLEPV